MPAILQSSLIELNVRIDAEQFLTLLGASHIQHQGPELRTFCPIHGSDNQRSLAVHPQNNVGKCHNTGCPALEGGNLLWLWSLKHNVSVDEAAMFWARELGFQLEFTQKKESPQPEDFIYRELGGVSEGRFWRNKIIQDSEVLTAFQSLDVDCHQSMFKYNISDMQQLRQALQNEEALLYGSFFADFDNPFPGEKTPENLQETPFEGISSFEEGIHKAQQDIIQSVVFLLQHHIPEEAISLYFSGRGFHLEINPRIFGVRPSHDLHHIYRELAFLIAGVEEEKEKIVLEYNADRQPVKTAYPARLQTLDQGLYLSNRLCRVQNTLNTKSSKYKIPFSWNELSSKLSAKDILELASQSRQVPVSTTEIEVDYQARRLFIQAWRNLGTKRQHNLRGNPAEHHLSGLGYRIAHLNRYGKVIQGHVDKEVANAAAYLARNSRCPVIIAVKDE